MIQFLIAVDQVLNTLTWARLEGFGFADETLSARMWRLRASPNWRRAQKATDFVFAALFNDHHHCWRSFLDEYHKHQLPEDYRAIAIDTPEWFTKY